MQRYVRIDLVNRVQFMYLNLSTGRAYRANSKFSIFGKNQNNFNQDLEHFVKISKMLVKTSMILVKSFNIWVEIQYFGQNLVNLGKHIQHFGQIF